MKNCLWPSAFPLFSFSQLLFVPLFLSLASFTLHFFFIFHSVWLSFCHFLSPSVSWLLTASPSLPPSVSTYLYFSFFLLLSSDCCLTLTLSLFHSALPSLPLQCLSPSLSLSAFLLPSCLPSPPPLLLISPSLSLSLYLSFSLFSVFLSPSPPLDSCLL